MMKKLLLLGTLIFAVHAGSLAQSQQKVMNNNIPVNDTLRYFTYKQLYKAPTFTVHPFFKSKAAVFTNTLITHVGSVFRNKDQNLMVTGLEARVLVPNLVQSGPQVGGVPFRLYLCNVDAQGMPVLPALDSVYAGISSTLPAGTGIYVGATFTAGPKPVTGDFAVLARCVSGQDGDTVKIMRTAGMTATSSANAALKFGEKLGRVRSKGIWFRTTDFPDPQFGPGTDYEFCVAPMVQFTLQVSQIESATQEGACEWEVFTNTNTSSPEFTNRQFNFNEFYRRLQPFNPSSAIATSFSADSVLAWDMGDGQNPYYLQPDWDTVHLAYASGVSNTFFTGSVTGKYKQSAYNVNAQTIAASLVFTASTVWCNDSAGSGINEPGPLSRVKIYPNPTVDKTTITGLTGSNTISIYNMIGQLVSTEVTTQETVLVDLLKQPQGNYLVKISDSQNHTRLVKVIRQ